MAPTVNASNTTFSQCSLDTIVPRSRSAACITGLAPADVSVASDLGTTRHPLGRTFELGVDVVNVGGTNITVRGNIVNGVVRISTFFIP